MLLVAMAVAPAARADAHPESGPELDAAGTTLYADQGRLEIKGARLAGVHVIWRSGVKTGEDGCLAPSAGPNGKGETCGLTVPRDLAPDASFTWTVTTGAQAGPGPARAPEPLRPARIVLDRLLAATATVDLTGGVGRLAVAHPEAVAAVDCAPARCEPEEAAILVRALSVAATSLTLRIRLAPRYFIARGDALDGTTTRTIPILHCAAAIVSGPPLRRVEATKMILKVDGRCGGEPRELRWTVNGELAAIERVERVDGATYLQLGVGDVEDAQVTVTATRPEPDGSVVAVARVQVAVAPQPRAILELPGFGKIPFIPTNRDALLRSAPVGDHAHLVPLPVEGAYLVRAEGRLSRVRGEESAGGFVALRFGYRLDTLPPAFAATDLAILTEPLQRPVREASVPVSLATSTAGTAALLELLCAGRSGRVRAIAQGEKTSIPFAERDSCRLVIHRERFKTEDGTQDVTVEVNVTKLDDSSRADAHLSERMVLRAGTQPRVFWIHGMRAPFDRLTVRVSHMVDEAHDVGGSELYVNLPAAQWSVVVGEGHFRFYATAAIPTGLFRMTAPSDVLTLNFGALSRLTWLDREGHEGLVGLELGAMGIGLAATPGFPRTLAILGGLGVGVPIGNRGEPSQASVNLHAWIAYELRDDFPLNAKDPASPLASHWSFLFGPSITIGNVGTDL